MPEDFVAATQYGDLKGTAALDGYEGPPLHELAKLTDMPAGYRPVGLSFSTFHVTDGTVPFNVVAVRVSEAGDNVDDLAKYAAAHGGKLPVYSFSGKIKPGDLERLFKRVSVKVILKSLAGFAVTVEEGE